MIILFDRFMDQEPRALYLIKKKHEQRAAFMACFNHIVGPDRADINTDPIIKLGLVAKKGVGKTSLVDGLFRSWPEKTTLQEGSSLRPQSVSLVQSMNGPGDPYVVFHYDKKTDQHEDVPSRVFDAVFRGAVNGLDIIENPGYKFSPEGGESQECKYAFRLYDGWESPDDLYIEFYCEDADFIREDVQRCLQNAQKFEAPENGL